MAAGAPHSHARMHCHHGFIAPRIVMCEGGSLTLTICVSTMAVPSATAIQPRFFLGGELRDGDAGMLRQE